MDQIRFPGESADYRAARDRLRAAEIELTQQIDAVAELRRRLPMGGSAQDYLFTEGPADLGADEPIRPVRLSELFAPERDTLLLYSFMYGPEMDRACPMSTSLLDGLDGSAPDIMQRVGFAVVAKSPIERIRAYARTRGWVNHRLLSSAGTSYNRDYHGEDAEGNQESTLNVFVRRAEEVHHFYGTEKAGPFRPGQDDRHVDLLWPLWHALDLTPAGRSDWRPSYSPKVGAVLAVPAVPAVPAIPDAHA